MGDLTPKISEDVKQGRRPLYIRMTESQLLAVCNDVSTGNLTLEGAIGKHVVTSPASIQRAREAGIEALEKLEAGAYSIGEVDAPENCDRLTAREEAALVWFSVICKALSHREEVLTAQARSGVPGCKEALEILKLTCRHYRPVSEVQQTIQGSLNSATPDLERRLMQLLSALTPTIPAPDECSETP